MSNYLKQNKNIDHNSEVCCFRKVNIKKSSNKKVSNFEGEVVSCKIVLKAVARHLNEKILYVWLGVSLGSFWWTWGNSKSSAFLMKSKAWKTQTIEQEEHVMAQE